MKKGLLSAILLMLFSITLSFGQKLKSGNWEVSFDKFEKKEVSMFGDSKTVYKGVINIKRGKTKMKPQIFNFEEKDGVLVKFTIRDNKNKILEPTINYSVTNNQLTYKNSKGEELKETPFKSSNKKEKTLSAMLVWLNYK